MSFIKKMSQNNMYKHFIYLKTYLFKKKSFWILSMLPLIANLLVFIILPYSTNSFSPNDKDLAELNTSSDKIYNSFIAVFIYINYVTTGYLLLMLFSAQVALLIFKTQEVDGVELILISKPITRTQMLATRFIMLCVTLIVGILISSLPLLALAPKINSELLGQLIGGYIIGGIFASFLFASITMLLATFLGPNASFGLTFSVAIVFAFIVPLVFYLVPVKDQYALGLNFGGNMLRLFFITIDSDKYFGRILGTGADGEQTFNGYPSLSPQQEPDWIVGGILLALIVIGLLGTAFYVTFKKDFK